MPQNNLVIKHSDNNIFAKGVNYETRAGKVLVEMGILSTPKTLNTMCAIAALRAWVLAVSAATLEVTVVPIFSPITSAMP